MSNTLFKTPHIQWSIEEQLFVYIYQKLPAKELYKKWCLNRRHKTSLLNERTLSALTYTKHIIQRVTQYEDWINILRNYDFAELGMFQMTRRDLNFCLSIANAIYPGSDSQFGIDKP